MRQPINLELDEAALWERGKNEPEREYQAFLTFLHLGPPRSLYAAYRDWKAAKDGSRSAGRSAPAPPRNGHSAPRIAPPANWKRWQEEFRWKERAAAYDRWVADNTNTQIAQAQRRRIEERLELDAGKRDRIDRLRRRLADLEAAPLTKTVDETGELTIIHDRVKEYEALTKELRGLEEKYLAPAEAAFKAMAEITKPGGAPVYTKLIAGRFSVGDQMYDGDPPSLGSNGAPPEPPEPPKPRNPYDIDLDLTVIEGLYPPKDES